ncbi:uncharacterized protein LACBIDRAFT_399320, partial [Laccaria bicolor S238N-H82]
VRNKIIGFELHSMSPPDVLLNDFDIDYCTSQLISTCALQLNWYLFVPYLAWLTTPHSSSTSSIERVKNYVPYARSTFPG